MPTNTYLNRKTPGVYVTEIDAFPPSIVGVETAVPIFIGYTETAIDPVSGERVNISSSGPIKLHDGLHPHPAEFIELTFTQQMQGV
ncbi:MAG: hypothetical protein V4568_06350 [Pseudomonadota bacterium]